MICAGMLLWSHVPMLGCRCNFKVDIQTQYTRNESLKHVFQMSILQWSNSYTGYMWQRTNRRFGSWRIQWTFFIIWCDRAKKKELGWHLRGTFFLRTLLVHSFRAPKLDCTFSLTVCGYEEHSLKFNLTSMKVAEVLRTKADTDN